MNTQTAIAREIIDGALRNLKLDKQILVFDIKLYNEATKTLAALLDGVHKLND